MRVTPPYLAVSDVEHEVLDRLAHLCMVRVPVQARASSCMFNEHQELCCLIWWQIIRVVPVVHGCFLSERRWPVHTCIPKTTMFRTVGDSVVAPRPVGNRCIYELICYAILWRGDVDTGHLLGCAVRTLLAVKGPPGIANRFAHVAVATGGAVIRHLCRTLRAGTRPNRQSWSRRNTAETPLYQLFHAMHAHALACNLRTPTYLRRKGSDER